MAILVLADDITGAAEMAGLAHTMGCRVHFTTSVEGLAPSSEADVVVLATDTRSMGRKEAVQVTRNVVAHLPKEQAFTLFKKCDSALRGHLVAETEVLMEAGYDRALILAANPSKGRCVEEGVYRIDGIPIAETLFRIDPEFPATTSEVTALLGGAVHYRKADATPLPKGIFIGESRTVEEVAQHVAAHHQQALLVGAADAFRALLREREFTEPRPSHFEGLGTRQTLIVLGSTVRHDVQSEPFFQRNRVAQSPMPDAVFAGAGPEAWIEQSLAVLHAGESLLLRIPQQVEVDGAKALHLRRSMAATVSEVVCVMRPEEVVIEGGATAYALLEELGWVDFEVLCETAPGVVRLQHMPSGTVLTLKPGSYPWGPLFQ